MYTGMFLEHADEERTHGKKFVSYLRHRGDTETDFLGPDPILPSLGKNTWVDAEEALRDALHMEKMVTGSIKAIIDVCDNDSVSKSDHLLRTFFGSHLKT